ncbi:hypothetical protein MKW98_021966, partial [Papaver atlanticum]
KEKNTDAQNPSFLPNHLTSTKYWRYFEYMINIRDSVGIFQYSVVGFSAELSSN